MKFLRTLLLWLVFLVAALALAVFIPTVQTWAAQWALGRQTAVQASLGSLSAGFGGIDVSDLSLKARGVALTVPSLEARFPVATAVRERRVLVRSLVAKGWTLDLRHSPELARRGATPAELVAGVFHGALSRLRLPCDLSLDNLDLEGDVVVPDTADGSPVRVHLVLKGGGIAAGREGEMTIAAASTILDQQFNPTTYGAQGRLEVGMDTPRTFSRIELKTDLEVQGGASAVGGLGLSADLAAERGAGGETYAFDLDRADRTVAAIVARYSEAGGIAGTWRLDARDSDIAPFEPGQPLPSFSAAGDGRFDADAGLGRVHAIGRLRAAASDLGALAPDLGRLGAVTLDCDFDATRNGSSVRVGRLRAALAGVRPIATAEALQPFAFDWAGGALKAENLSGDLFEVSLRGLPVAAVSGLVDGFAFGGGNLAGAFVVRPEGGGFALRSEAPLTVSDLSVTRGADELVRRLDLSLPLAGEWTPGGWRLRAAPIAVGRGGLRLATIQAEASRSGGPDQPVAISGTWKADLGARSVAAAGGFPIRSASGDFSASVGASTQVDASLSLIGRDSSRSLAVNLHAETGDGGQISFTAPIKFAEGGSESDLTAEGALTREDSGPELEVKFSSQDVAMDNLVPLAGILLAAEGAPPISGGGPGAAEIRDRRPFWGDWNGLVTVAFDRLRAGNSRYNDVHGTFDVEGDSIRLENFRVGITPRDLSQMVALAGSLSFDPAAAIPYHVDGTASAGQTEAEGLFGPRNTDHPPPIEGRFTVSGNLTGRGINLDDLIRHTREGFRITSTDGIARVLATSVADSIPQAKDTTADELRSVGGALGSVIGIHRSEKEGKNPVSKNAEAVMDFTYDVAEIGWDQVTVAGSAGADGAIRLDEITLTAPDERITGSGSIAAAPGVPLRERPLSVDLKFWAHGRVAKYLSIAGLLSGQKDRNGYVLSNAPIHLGGTIAHVDDSQWHALLVKAALRPPPGLRP